MRLVGIAADEWLVFAVVSHFRVSFDGRTDVLLHSTSVENKSKSSRAGPPAGWLTSTLSKWQQSTAHNMLNGIERIYNSAIEMTSFISEYWFSKEPTSAWERFWGKIFLIRNGIYSLSWWFIWKAIAVWWGVFPCPSLSTVPFPTFPPFPPIPPFAFRGGNIKLLST